MSYYQKPEIKCRGKLLQFAGSPLGNQDDSFEEELMANSGYPYDPDCAYDIGNYSNYD